MRALGLAVLLVASPALAQSDATALERETIGAVVSYQAVLARLGADHETTMAHVREAERLRSELVLALASGANVDVAVVVAALEVDLADVEGRLRELGTRCGGPSMEVTAAEARRDALRHAIDRLRDRGAYVPTL